MKKFILIILPFICFSQNIDSRKKIRSFTSSVNQLQLINDLNTLNQERLQNINLFKALYPSINPLNLYDYKDGIPYFYSEFNDRSSITISANSLYPGGSLGLNVTGSSISCGVWDGGKVRTNHVEFTNSRAYHVDSSTSLSNHATHVTGTIIAAGVSPSIKGIAYNGYANSYDWTDDLIEMNEFANSGGLVSNHSYGYAVGSSTPNWIFGNYDSTARSIDNLCYTYPYYLPVIAAGNDRNDTDIQQVNDNGGYDMLKTSGCAKNSITVAAINEVMNYQDNFSVTMSSFSNFGPTDDGRIKPDISAKGVGTNSCISTSNGSYAVYSGTSMAAPAITGLIMLLQEHFFNTTGFYMKSSTARGLLCHSALESGIENGPDYSFGWGLANGKFAATIISNIGTSSIIEENTLLQNEVFTKTFSISNIEDIQVSVCWTDQPGNTNSAGSLNNRVPRLKNNLDIKIIKDGVIYFPWKLDPENPENPATNTSDNDVDNFEKIDIYSAEPGLYTIQVSHKGILNSGSQVFSLIASSTEGLSLNTRDYDFDNSIFVYPNPVKNILNFNLINMNEIESIIITDVTGKQIINSAVSLSHKAIDVSNLESGVYFIKFISDYKTIIKKFIKE
ncbi:S8 family serine peptidase [Flavobacterium sp.]|uniref:S8 family serine peptidase n=1 Tax=Flavobacterium sp. TaxID=239 RepID=UPI00333FEF5E